MGDKLEQSKSNKPKVTCVPRGGGQNSRVTRQFCGSYSLGLLIRVQTCTEVFRGVGEGEGEEGFVQVSDYSNSQK